MSRELRVMNVNHNFQLGLENKSYFLPILNVFTTIRMFVNCKTNLFFMTISQIQNLKKNTVRLARVACLFFSVGDEIKHRQFFENLNLSTPIHIFVRIVKTDVHAVAYSLIFFGGEGGAINIES